MALSQRVKETGEAQERLLSLTLVVAALFLVLLVRFWYLQIARGEYYQRESERNRTASIELPAPRGIIRDRNGVILATTRPAYSVTVLPAEVVNLDALLARLSQILGRPAAELKEDYHKKRIGRFHPVPIARDVPLDVVTALEEEKPYLRGVLAASEPVRAYPRGTFASHLLGYVREIDAGELAKLRDKGYRPGDLVGKTGVEKTIDEYLRGEVGKRRVERDAHGNLLRVLGAIEPVPGGTATLTLDARVQKAAETGLADQGKPGAAIAIDPRSGDVIALASSPTYDPGWFTRRLTQAEVRQLYQNPLHPMINRAIGSAQPPGSTFKIISATALLERKTVSTRSHAFCSGSLRIGNRPKRCWSTHGTVDVYLALAKSCDVFFYQYGMMLSARSPAPISEWAERFGCAHRSGIPLLGEVTGNVPHLPEKGGWWPGDTANLIIGQGALKMTPLQVAQMTAVIANGGTLYRPRVVREVVSVDGKQRQQFPVEVAGKVPIHPEVLAIVRQGLRMVVTSGTGRTASLDQHQIAVAGKTGSAEHHRDKKAHAWFTCYAPYEKPTIAIAILVEEGWHGATAAAPIARAMMEAHFGLTKTAPAPAPAGMLGD
ncbi:MAG: penicillin-binding protein 2 [Armatimonadetes bacterium]|nr:penicillin-binding protein 2 [Armatimonadota bacterium]